MTVSPSLFLECRSSRHRVPRERDADLVLLTSLRAVEPREEPRNPVDIVVVLDHSYSMLEGGKLELCKKTLAFMCREILGADDRLGLVVFDSDVQVVYPCEKMTEANKERFLAKLKAVQVGSHTNLSAGVFQGLDVLKAVDSRSEVSALLVLSDGEITSGITDRQKLRRMVTNMVASFQTSSKPTVHCFGYGATYDPILTDLAQDNAGMFYHVGDVEQVPLAFADTLGGLLHMAAQNVRVRIEVVGNGAKLVRSPLLKGPAIEPVSETVWNLKVRDIYIGERKDLLVEIHLSKTDVEVAGGNVQVNVQMQYMDLIQEKQNTLQTSIVISRVKESEIVDSDIVTDVEIERQMIRLGIANALEEARVTAEQGNSSASVAKIDSQVAEVDRAMKRMQLDETRDPMLKDLMSDLRNARNILSASSSASPVQQSSAFRVMQSVAWSHANQRTNTVNDMLEQVRGLSDAVLSTQALGGEAASDVPTSTFSYNTASKQRMLFKTKAAFGMDQ